MAALNRSQLVLIGGDLNDTPQSVPIKEVLKDGFVDVIDHPSYPQDRKGTYDTGLDNNKIDYLIMSPALRGKLTDTGIERRGTYHPKLWASFDTVTKSSEEASDHHLVWATFNL
jgi:exonuclease III